jgi:hypothetical protein
VADVPIWRQGYDAFERELGPRLETLVRSEAFAVAVGLVARVQRAVQQEASRATRRVLHQLNLPAGSDVSRILNELGQLRRQVRELSAELEETRAALVDGARPAARRATAARAAPRPRAAKATGARKRSASTAPAKTGGASRGARVGS